MKELNTSDLTLLLMYLLGWEEDSHKNPGEKIYCYWNEHSFKCLNNLHDNKLIFKFKDKALVIITELGQNKAKELIKEFEEKENAYRI